MITFIFRRLVGVVLTLLMASMVVFFVLEVLPGDPARAILGVEAEAEAQRLVQEEAASKEAQRLA